MKNLNESNIKNYYINEVDMRFEALAMLREIQSQLVGTSFLQVIALMKEQNPLRGEVLAFQDDLDELTAKIGEFVKKAKDEVEYESSAEEIAAAADDNPELDDEGNPIDNQEQKELRAKGKTDRTEDDEDGKKKKKKVKDSSESDE